MVKIRKEIDKALKRWEGLSDGGSDLVPKLFTRRWIFAIRPNVADMNTGFKNRIQDPEGLGKDRWIRNDINVVFREFVEGRDLEEILGDPGLTDEDKIEAVKTALQRYVDIWNETKDKDGRGLFIGDPKPANIVLYGAPGSMGAKIIDLDALREFSGIRAVISALRHYPEYDWFDIVESGSRAIVLEKFDTDAEFLEPSIKSSKRNSARAAYFEIIKNIYNDNGKDYSPEKVLAQSEDGTGDQMLEATEAIAREILPQYMRLSSSRILDLGTGHGLVLMPIAVQGALEVFGMDISKAMLAEAAKDIRAAHLGNVKLVQSDMMEFDEALLKAGVPLGLDAIVSANTLHLLNKGDKKELMGKILAALKPGGAVVLLYRTADERNGPNAKMLKTSGYKWDGGYETPDEWKAFLESAGFEFVESRFEGSLYDVSSDERPISDTYIVVARKPAARAAALTKGVVKKGAEQKKLEEEMTRMMDAIHTMNLELIQPVEEGKTMWHVIPVSLIPQDPRYNLRTKFIELVREMERLYPEAREKIRIVTDKQDLANVVNNLAKDPNNIVDVALDSESLIDKLPDSAKMLIFEAKDGDIGDFRQLEGILAGLRALHIKDYNQRIEKLSRIYKFLTGESPKNIPAASDSLKEFARKFKFILLPITIEDKEALRRLNENLLRLIEAA